MGSNLRTVYNSLHGMLWSALHTLPYVALAIIVYAIFHLAARALRNIITRISIHHEHQRNVGLVLGRLVQGTTMLLGVLVALVIAIPSFKPVQLVQLLGIGSVAIGFAFRDILQNFLAGILILLTEPFKIDDQIVVGEHEGTVEAIETRATMIRTYDGRRVVIPNSNIFTEAVMVNTAFPKRRLQYDVGIGYGDDIEHARELMLNALRGSETVLDDPAPEALVVDLAGSWVTIRIRWWMDPPRKLDTMRSVDRVLTAIKRDLTAAGIDLPFPTQQILFHDQTEDTDGDRSRQREGWPAGANGATVPRRATP
ncbi:mechanosensitive ion channel family protein [Terriglobus sp.]|uniref:mechanosensitive ion channel family protein n=1 Tax=Terriglobus sp. TaxID=1889013 RepID=UPI003B00F8EE